MNSFRVKPVTGPSYEALGRIRAHLRVYRLFVTQPLLLPHDVGKQIQQLIRFQKSILSQSSKSPAFMICLPSRPPATPVLLPGKFLGWRSLVGCSPWGRKESVTTEWLHFHFSLSCIGEENGNPLQCSCLENPRDGGAWWAAVYGLSQSQTQLKQLSSSSKTTWCQSIALRSTSSAQLHLRSLWLYNTWNWPGHNLGTLAAIRACNLKKARGGGVGSKATCQDSSTLSRHRELFKTGVKELLIQLKHVKSLGVVTPILQ